jgi:hypothetical protein
MNEEPADPEELERRAREERAARLRAEAERIARGEAPPPLSPRDAIHQRMRELREKEQGGKPGGEGGEPGTG